MDNDLGKIWNTHKRIEKHLLNPNSSTGNGGEYLHQYAHAHRGYLLQKFKEFKESFDEELIDELISSLESETKETNKKGLQIRQVLQTLKKYYQFVDSIPLKERNPL